MGLLGVGFAVLCNLSYFTKRHDQKVAVQVSVRPRPVASASSASGASAATATAPSPSCSERAVVPAWGRRAASTELRH
jgi:hypothetical protein